MQGWADSGRKRSIRETKHQEDEKRPCVPETWDAKYSYLSHSYGTGTSIHCAVYTVLLYIPRMKIIIDYRFLLIPKSIRLAPLIKKVMMRKQLFINKAILLTMQMASDEKHIIEWSHEKRQLLLLYREVREQSKCLFIFNVFAGFAQKMLRKKPNELINTLMHIP